MSKKKTTAAESAAKPANPRSPRSPKGGRKPGADALPAQTPPNATGGNVAGDGPRRKAKAPASKAKRLSALDAAAAVLAESGKPMRAAELIQEMQNRGLWKSPGGKTPDATLYAAIIREIASKGKEARFKKLEKGVFGNNA